MSKGVSSAYTGRFQQMVPSVGSRLSGVVKPSYGKARIIVRMSAYDNPVRQDNTGAWIGGQVIRQDADTQALNPRRLSRRQRIREQKMREFLKIKGVLNTPKIGAPRLRKPA